MYGISCNLIRIQTHYTDKFKFSNSFSYNFNLNAIWWIQRSTWSVKLESKTTVLFDYIPSSAWI